LSAAPHNANQPTGQDPIAAIYELKHDSDFTYAHSTETPDAQRERSPAGVSPSGELTCWANALSGKVGHTKIAAESYVLITQPHPHQSERQQASGA